MPHTAAPRIRALEFHLKIRITLRLLTPISHLRLKLESIGAEYMLVLGQLNNLHLTNGTNYPSSNDRPMSLALIVKCDDG